MIDLEDYGLSSYFKEELDSDLKVGRVLEQHNSLYKLIGEEGEVTGKVSGKFTHDVSNPIFYPAVGDWVLFSNSGDFATIHSLLKRKSQLIRKSAGTNKEGQVIASNIDTIFICMSLNRDFNLRRLERYLTITWDSGAKPVVILTKADLCDDLEEKLMEVRDIAIGVDIISTTSKSEGGYEEIRGYIKSGETASFIGSSGVGKSTIINFLMGEEVLNTSSIREDDDRGRHTTTHRQLLLLPSGGVVIDTPGMREIRLFEGNIERTFLDIEEISKGCRFSDCTHTSEPGCAVKLAIENGDLSYDRLESYRKLQRELSYNNLNSRELEEEKIKRMFGGKKELKRMKKELKNKR